MTEENSVVPFDMSEDDAKIAELAQLSMLQYDQCREVAAKDLGIRVSVLDKLVEDKRPKHTEDEVGDPFETVEPWHDPVDGAQLLSEVKTAIRRFCILPEFSDTIIAMWVLHAWTHDAADISPILAFVSPEKRCGKTTALSIVGALVPKPMHAVNISTSVLFRVIEKHQPTLLIDEGDTFLATNDELRGIINGGHNRLSAYVWRSVGDDFDPCRFKVWAPKCIAMIGKLPDTLEDRALVVPLRRKKAGEKVERFRADRVNDFLDLRRKCQRWANDNIDLLCKDDPQVPDELDDRAQDNARAICAIADLAGGDWPETVRAALVGLAEQNEEESQSPGVLLLRDIAEILGSRQDKRLGSGELCNILCNLEESPWGEWRRGSPITTRGIAKLLKPYGIKPRRDRNGSCYWQTDFTDPIKRYLSDHPSKTVTTATSATGPESTTEKPNENNISLQNGSCGSCDSSTEGLENKHNPMSEYASDWEGEL